MDVSLKLGGSEGQCSEDTPKEHPDFQAFVVGVGKFQKRVPYMYMVHPLACCMLPSSELGRFFNKNER